MPGFLTTWCSSIFFLTSLRSGYPDKLRYQKLSYPVPPGNNASIIFGASGHLLRPGLLWLKSLCSVFDCLMQNTGHLVPLTSSRPCGSSCRGGPRMPRPPTISLSQCRRIPGWLRYPSCRWDTLVSAIVSSRHLRLDLALASWGKAIPVRMSGCARLHRKSNLSMMSGMVSGSV